MRLLVISDTHRHIGPVIDLLQGDHRFDRILHLGDMVQDALDLESLFDLPLDVVSGNCDWGSAGVRHHEVLELAGKRIFMTHGHMEHVKAGDGLLRKIATKENYDVILYGHTHHADVQYEGDCILMNPGSIGLPRDGAPSYGVIHIDESGTIHTNIVRIES